MNHKYYKVMKFLKTKLLFALIMISLSNYAQNKIHIEGYVSNMQSVMFDSFKNNWINDNLIHNRLNFKYTPTNSITFAAEFRNRIMTGESVKYIPNYAEGIDTDKGFIDMSFNLVEEQSVLINSNIDRLYFSYEKGNFNITIGRQRINWGQTFVWNPNDIFNSYSFFDFDYVEKPGSDAIRLQYYTGIAASLEAAVKINSEEEITAAGKFIFNKYNYDFQLIGGIIDEEDYVGGIGWSGNLWQLTFRGEGSYLHPKDNFSDTTGLFIGAVGFDYMFANSTMISCEFLYNQQPKTTEIANFLQIYDAPQSVKNLSFTEYNIFGQITYPFNPLISGTLSSIYYPKLQGFFAGPSITFSLMNNLDFSLITQSFSGNFDNPITSEKQRIWYNLIFMKMKYSF